MKKLLIAAALCTAGVANAALEQFDFSYISFAGNELKGSLLGELQADNNTIVVDSIIGFPSFAGFATPVPLTPVISVSSAFGTPSPAVVSANGSVMDILACNVLPACDVGFGFWPPLPNLPNGALSLGTAWAFGGPFEPFVPANWSIVAVPEPMGLALTGVALAALALTRRRKNA